MTPGLNSAAAYQASGYPWVTQSYATSTALYTKIELPSVCKAFTIYNHDANDVWPYTMTGSTALNVFFGADLTGTYPPLQVTNRHAVPIPISGSQRFEVKCSQFFVGKKHAAGFGAFTIVAEMTPISHQELLYLDKRDAALTGSGIDG